MGAIFFRDRPCEYLRTASLSAKPGEKSGLAPEAVLRFPQPARPHWPVRKENPMPKPEYLTIFVIALLTCTAAVSSEEVRTQNGDAAMKPPTRMPFLVDGKMPHLTGILKQHWDDPNLELTTEQKTGLLLIRKNTMSAVMGLVGELDQLESSLAEQAMAATPPDQLAPLVDKISGLKAEATMVHLRCIHDTMEILDDRQLATLLDMAGPP